MLMLSCRMTLGACLDVASKVDDLMQLDICRGLNPKSTLKGVNALDSDQRLLSISAFVPPDHQIPPATKCTVEPTACYVVAASSDARLTLHVFQSPTRRYCAWCPARSTNVRQQSDCAYARRIQCYM